MKISNIMMAALAAVVFTVGTAAEAQKVPDPRVADLVQAGKLRVALGLGSPALAIKDAKTGEVRGPALVLARALAAKIGVELQVVEYPRPGAILGDAGKNKWDVTFLVFDPARVADADFSPPICRAISPIWWQADRPSVRSPKWTRPEFASRSRAATHPIFV
jgi:ABC-type amino acid transport substrate-binding protein